jgi:hypothetical protein
LLQTGGTVLALERALGDGVPVFNLGGGFHHAQRDRAEGFCPINDVAVAIRRAQQRRLARRFLVLDLDYHQGNGTALIFDGDESVFTLSVHGQSWSHVVGKRNNIDIEVPAGTGDEKYMGWVRQSLARTLAAFRPDAAIYLAGGDVHRGDEMGDFAVSEEGVLDRDLYVFSTLREAGVPLAVVLAGGYGPMAWTLPYNFIHSVLTGARIRPEQRPSNIEATYRRVKRSLSTSDLRLGAGELDDVTMDELVIGKRTGDLLMDFYTCEGLETALERYGFMDLLRERGFDNLLVSIETSDPDHQVTRIHFDRADPEHLLVELVVRFRNLVTPREAVDDGVQECFRMLSIEWLLMQNPRATFSLARRKLPGQHYPGLGLGRWMLELLRMMTERLDCCGLMNIPQHYHNAYLYSKQMLCFLPQDQGYLEAMKRDLRQMPLVETSEAIDSGRLRDAATGERLEWEGKAQVMPVEPELNAYFARPAYIQAVAEARQRHRFELAPG